MCRAKFLNRRKAAPIPKQEDGAHVLRDGVLEGLMADKFLWVIVAITPQGACGGVNVIEDEARAKGVFALIVKGKDRLLEPGAVVDIFRCRIIEQDDQLPPELRMVGR